MKDRLYYFVECAIVAEALQFVFQRNLRDSFFARKELEQGCFYLFTANFFCFIFAGNLLRFFNWCSSPRRSFISTYSRSCGRV
jgi:hypothetical protein